MPRSTATPLVIAPHTPARRLERVQLGAGFHDEAWLQARLDAHPGLIPLGALEPGFGELIAVAREVPCGHGFIDNLYLTPSGEIVFVEAKLWRNPGARREVVAQTLDYVAALTRLSYAGLEAAVLRGQPSAPHTCLYDFVASHPLALDEARFVDAVARNLRRGRLIALVIGDGIQAEAETLADLLQSHAGAHFTFALVELAIWRDSATDTLLLCPNILARTVMIERGIVRLADTPALVVAPPALAAPADLTKPKAQSITEQQFYEQLAAKDAALPGLLQGFIARLEPLGVYPDILKTLNLKAEVATEAKPQNFGYVATNGQLHTSMLGWTAGEAIARDYVEKLATLTGGTVATHDGIYLATANGKSRPLLTALLPAHADGWLAAIRAVIVALERRAAEQG